MNLIETFRAVADDPSSYAAGWKKNTGRPVIGHVCSYMPEEIIDAAGALAFRILPENKPITMADAHFQSYACSLVRGILEARLSGQLDFLDLTVFPHTCDAVQRLSDIWRMNSPKGSHEDLLIPSVLNTSASIEYMTRIFSGFRRQLESLYDQKITDEAVRVSMKRMNAIRAKFAEIYTLMGMYPKILPAADLLAVQRAGFIMDKAEFLKLLESLYRELEDQAKTKSPEINLKRILLSGGICALTDIGTIIEDAGATVIWDDLCTGARYSEGLTDESLEECIKAIALRYSSRTVCPAKHGGINTRGAYLVEKAAVKSIDGVIFLYLKFCDPHAFDYPCLKGMLDDEGIPSLKLELEGFQAGTSGLKTRCQAFIEML